MSGIPLGALHHFGALEFCPHHWMPFLPVGLLAFTGGFMGESIGHQSTHRLPAMHLLCTGAVAVAVFTRIPLYRRDRGGQREPFIWPAPSTPVFPGSTPASTTRVVCT